MSLQKNLPPWLPLSFLLAQHLVQHKLHKRVLTPVERKYFQDATSSFATWIAFINGQPEHTFIELDTTAFRVRSMLYEQFIPHLFHAHRPCCKLLDLEPLIEQARHLAMPSSQDIAREWELYIEAHVKKQAAQPHHNVSTTAQTTAADEPKHEDEQNQGLPRPLSCMNISFFLIYF